MNFRITLVFVALLVGTSASVAKSATTTCSTVAACIFGQNTSSGIGIEGTSSSGHGVEGHSLSGFGIVGFTTQNATSASNGKAGVEGEDGSTNGNHFDAGVYGESANGQGVYGHSTGNYGIQGESTATNYLAGAGVGAFSQNGAAIFAQSGTIGVVAFQAQQGAAGEAIYADTYGNSSSTAIVAVARNGGRVFVGSDGSGDVASIDSSGNMILKGSLIQHGAPLSVIQATSGQQFATYAAQTATPTVEDFGRSTLRQGRTYVALEPAFASTIDRSSYMVFLTPEGDSHGLYTTPSPTGFTVRENGGGHSSLAFSYRIVAKPAMNSAAARLPATSQFLHLKTTPPSSVIPRAYPAPLR